MNKFDSWSRTWVDVIFLLIWWDVIWSLEFDHLILSRLNANAWFEEAEHMVFLKLEFWKKVCIFKGVSIFEESCSLGRKLVEVGVLKESSYLSRSFNLQEQSTLGDKDSSSSWKILSKPFGVKIFQPLQMRRTLLFVKFSSGLYELELGWSLGSTTWIWVISSL